jgi:hypothetical protein
MGIISLHFVQRKPHHFGGFELTRMLAAAICFSSGNFLCHALYHCMYGTSLLLGKFVHYDQVFRIQNIY